MRRLAHALEALVQGCERWSKGAGRWLGGARQTMSSVRRSVDHEVLTRGAREKSMRMAAHP
ncbi:hypothetical protein H641_00025 [Cutibacterium granulosum DSM 20700]|uniref:Uncharacterized protein n=1 Tax=Cutibacterium granulosum DSM 20700 TaxID=1160719 RepID=U1F3K2_9ACTN|nr:hypothetical protein H641_00025 [Cutibacterium granulosum DSM 20700]